MKRLETMLLATCLCLVATGVGLGQNRGGGGGGMGGGGMAGGGHVSHGVGRPFITGVKQGSPAAFGRGGAFAAGIGAGYPGGFGYGYGGFGFGGFGGWNGFANDDTVLYRLGYLPLPPYFALHPPVYYGQRIFRSYGDSPYADYAFPRAYRQPVIPQYIQNPLMPVISAGGGSADRADASLTAQMIVNPFYDGPGLDASRVASAADQAR